MDLKFVKNLSDKSATMLLYQEIGKGYGIDGAAFAEELYWLSKNVPLINVRINSPGGSIFEGYSIYSAMREVKADVDTYNDFIAASMGGIIAQQGRKRYAANNSLIMLHNPSGGGESKKDKEILGLLKNSLVDSYTARTGSDGKLISELMDVETWVEARMVNGVSSMLEMGLADELFESSVKIAPTAQIFNAQKLFSYANKILTKNEMEQEKLDELSKQVSELTNSLAAMKAENEAKEAEVKALKDSLAEKENVLKEQNDKVAVELIENAIKEGKVKAEAREQLIVDAKNSLNVVKAMLDAIPATTASRFTNVVGSGAKPETDVKKDWSIRDYEENDPKALAEIMKNSPEVYQEMFNKFYKK